MLIEKKDKQVILTFDEQYQANMIENMICHIRKWAYIPETNIRLQADYGLNNIAIELKEKIIEF